MQRNSYLVTATRDAEKVPDIVQLARGSLINEIITVVVISLNLNPGRVGPPNGHLYHLVQRFFLWSWCFVHATIISARDKPNVHNNPSNSATREQQNGNLDIV